MINQLILVIPEISIALVAMFVQIVSVFFRKLQIPLSFLVVTFLLSLACFISLNYTSLFGYGFNNSYFNDDITLTIKLLLLIFFTLIIFFYLAYASYANNFEMEYLCLMMFSVIGMFISISARDFLVMYIGLELQTLPMYILASFNVFNSRSSESGVKYFILGALASGIMLFGISLIYGFSGTTNFLVINDLYQDAVGVDSVLFKIPAAVIVGIVMVLSGLCFKLSAAPFHFWTPDVYEGSPIISTCFFATLPKLASLVVLGNICYRAFYGYEEVWLMLIKVMAVASLIIGSFGAIMQNSLKRLMAYSSITNVGYILASFSCYNLFALKAATLFMLVYIVALLALFALIIIALGEHADYADITDLSGLSSTNKIAALSISIILFSMIGIPPFAGFFTKLYILKFLLESQNFFLLSMALLATVVSSFYYLRVIKIMYFDIPNISKHRNNYSLSLVLISFILILFLIFFVFFVDHLINI